MCNNFFFFFKNCAIYEIMLKNVVEQGRPQITIWRMCIACCNTSCFSTATAVARTRLNVTLYIHRLS